jgi:hypothetical protein
MLHDELNNLIGNITAKIDLLNMKIDSMKINGEDDYNFTFHKNDLIKIKEQIETALKNNKEIGKDKRAALKNEKIEIVKKYYIKNGDKNSRNISIKNAYFYFGRNYLPFKDYSDIFDSVYPNKSKV